MTAQTSTTERYRALRERRHAFQADSVARAYACRPPYPDEVFERLAALLAPGSSRVLDAGCGPGKIARGLARRMPALSRIDAVDASEAMLEAGRRAPGGDDPRIRFGVDVVLDLNFWSRAQRDEVRARAVALGANVRLYRLTCSDDEAWRRIEARNVERGGSLHISRATFETLQRRFEPLDDDEAAGVTVP